MSRFRRSAAVSETPDSQALVSVSALGEVAAQLAKVHTPDEVIQKALDVVRKAFDMRYSSCWWLDAQSKNLLFRQESGEVGSRFREVTKQASFARGVGLAGRAWAEGRLVFAPDLADVHDCVRAPAARESGVQSAVAFPITVDGEIVGTMDFMADPGAAPDAARQQVLSTVGVLVSQALERCVERSRRAEMEADMGAMNQVLHAVTVAHSEEAAIKAALDSIRGEFGWEYGSFWAVDPAEKVLRYSIESGDAGEEFRAVTRKATFAEGVGLAGRTWKSRALVFEPDMGQVTDCVRAPAAQRAGVKAGVCLPITAGDVVVGTMDFFSTHSITLTADREAALRNTAFLVSNAVDRFRAAGRIETAGQELLSSITEVERNVLQASNVAAEAKSLTAEATRIVASLNTSSEEIGNVVKVITSIAEQTNLLALNATIEAARAGEAGKGFAVVASEVKELARETATATEEVGQKVAAIQRDAASVVKALDGVTATVNEINEAQHIIGGVLTEQNAVTRSVLEG